MPQYIWHILQSDIDGHDISVGLAYRKPETDPPIVQDFTILPNIGSSIRITVDMNAANPGGFGLSSARNYRASWLMKL